MLNIEELLIGQNARLRHIVRFNNSPRIKDESVAEHSYYTSFYSLVLCEVLTEFGAEIDKGKLLSKAILHDMDESFSGDFVRMYKNATPELRDAIENTNKKLIDSVFRGLFNKQGRFEYLSKYLSLEWINCKDDSIEGEIVSFADFLSVLSYVLHEVGSGNRSILKYVKAMDEYLSSFNHFLIFQQYEEAKLWKNACEKILKELYQ